MLETSYCELSTDLLGLSDDILVLLSLGRADLRSRVIIDGVVSPALHSFKDGFKDGVTSTVWLMGSAGSRRCYHQLGEIDGRSAYSPCLDNEMITFDTLSAFHSPDLQYHAFHLRCTVGGGDERQLVLWRSDP